MVKPLVHKLPNVCPYCGAKMEKEFIGGLARSRCTNPECGYWKDQMGREGREPMPRPIGQKGYSGITCSECGNRMIKAYESRDRVIYKCPVCGFEKELY